MLAVPIVVLLGLVLTGIGFPFVLGLDRNRRLTDAERVLCATLLGSLIFHFSVQAVGHFRLDRSSMAILGLFLLVMALPGWRAIPWNALAENMARLPRLLLALLLIVCVVSFLQGLAPPNDYDSLMYHLAQPKADIERGFIAPNWMRGIANIFFPHFVTSFVRFSLALVGEQATQPAVALLGLAATAGTGLLALRLGASLTVGLWAALLFAAVRAVVWEMGTVEVDLPLAATAVAATIVALAAREQKDLRLWVLFGLLIGISFNVKYQGGLFALSFAPLLLLDLFRGRVSFLHLAVMALTALAVFIPHMAENCLTTGNPIFPLYHDKFVAGGVPFYQNYNLTYGVGRGFLDLLIAPWLLFAAPMQHFDGMVLGSPYLLVLLPCAFVGWRHLRHGAATLSVVGFYYFLWFTLQSQQVRFLLPVVPAMAAFSAIGAALLWQASAPSRWLRIPAALLLAGLFVNQALFVGIYAAIRLPVALGIMSAADYHAKTPTLDGAYYATCRYVSEHLEPDERYLSFIVPHSYYCPQLAAITDFFDEEQMDWIWTKGPKKIGFEQFLKRLDQEKIRFVVLQLASENRRNVTGEVDIVPISVKTNRFGPFIAPALAGLQPVFKERYAAIYDGRQLMKRLHDALDSGVYPSELR